MSLSPRNFRYSTLEKIGEGSFSEVNKIHDKYSKRYYAAKVLKENFESVEAAMCCNEIIALRALQHHPNVAGITDFFYDPSTRKLTIITELAQMNLYEYIKDRKRCLSEIRCKHFLYQLVSGLRYLHGREIFHRDIKPENCLVKIDKRLGVNPIQAEILQLTDFGMVCNFNEKPPLSAYISTRWYRAPEVILTDGYYGPPVDVWALGCIFYEILTLKPLFPGENQTDQMNKIHNVLGSPSKDVLKRMKHTKTEIQFQSRKGSGLHCLLSTLSGDGMDIWRRTLEYRADLRINAFQMFEHSYFNNLKLDTRSSKSKSMIVDDDRIFPTSKSNVCLSRKLQASEVKLKERLWGMNPEIRFPHLKTMTSTTDDPSLGVGLIPSLESLQIDRPSKSRSSSICSNDDSICSLEIVELGAYQITSDELPIFSISSLSPTSRSLSPVMADQMCISPVDFSDSDDEENSNDVSTINPDRMLLNDIHALIGTPDEKNDRRLLNLETIFEDVFLETPPKRKPLTPQQYERKRYSFESISRYVKDQQQFEYCNEMYEDFNSVNSECLQMEQNKPDL